MPPPANKQRLERAAWQWAESCDPDHVTAQHVRTAYRLEGTACKNGNCRRNCRGSPLCLNALGEGKWLGSIDDKYWYEVEDPEEERRPKDTFAGLKNLGATCYVNTFLQLWFHNVKFRQAVYKYQEYRYAAPASSVATSQPPDTAVSSSSNQNGSSASNPTAISAATVSSTSTHSPSTADTHENSTETMDSSLLPNPIGGHMDSSLLPNTIGGHLQQVFALLQFSERRYIDPTPFINSLGLDAALQQDAQEFSKLFLSLLEDNLSTQLEPSVRNLVQEQCLGQYQYVTKCSRCKAGSERSAEFYELDLPIRGHKNLHESIDEFLQEEKLDGDNQYMCGSCNSKQNAVRYIELKRLPPVLNLQLLRFVFDRTTGHKKKLNSFLEFPETLDLSKYLHQAAGGSTLYDLSAVLIHRGPSAYSGHYIAHVKAEGGDTWYKFNDEEIEKMGGRNLQLGREEDIEGKEGKKPKTAKGHHASRNAYMLVYVRREHKTDPSMSSVAQLADLPAQLRQFVEQDNHRLEEWIKDMTNTREQNVQKGRERQSEIRQLYNMSFISKKDGSGDFDLLPSAWLSKWLASDYTEKVPAISTEELLCCHGKVSPDKAGHAKQVSAEAADLFYAKYGNADSHRLNGEAALCRQCVVERCRAIRTKSRMEDDNKAITAALKAKDNLQGVSDCYWVGKASLRSWKRLAVEKMKEREQQTTAAASNVNGNNHQNEAAESADKEEKKKEEEEAAGGDEEDASAIDRITFNEDLLCIDHDELALDEGCRKLVSGDVWRRLRVYFPAAPQYPIDAHVCSKCTEAVQSEQRIKEELRQAAKEQKSVLSNLYYDKSRPRWAEQTNRLFIVPSVFLDEWRKFIREPGRRDPVATISNALFLCERHQGFVYKPETIGTDPTTINRLSFVYPEEWQVLENSFSIDTPIHVTRTKNEDDTYSFHVSPAVCEECCEERMKTEQELRFHYRNATIYVLKVTDHNQILAAPAETISPVTPQTENSKEEEEEEYIEENNGKRKKSTPDVGGTPEKVARMDIRRSTRHRRLRGEKPLTVDASHTLKQLKVQIMKQFSVAPFDQNLWLNGSLLTADSSSSLASLGVLPGATIYLKEDEPTEDPGYIEDISSASHIEEGFKGTGLAGLR